MSRPSRADVLRVLAGEPTLAQQRARAWAAVTTQAKARKAAPLMGLTQAAAVRALQLREERRAHRGACGCQDALASRRPVAERWLARALQNAYDGAKLRGATHGHSVVLTVGEPGAKADTRKVHPRDAGLPRSYDYSVTQSAHSVTFARDWLVAVKRRGAAWVGGALVLALATEPDEHGCYAATWVRQGPGTSLVVVAGHLAQRDGRWVQCSTARKSRAA